MCSIFCILDIREEAERLRETAVRNSGLMKHRGPDWSGVWNNDKAILAHQRLAIVDVENGAQPLENAEADKILAVNGEIYNHVQLKSELKVDYEFQTNSDCEIILALYKQSGAAFLDELRGMFAFVLYDAEQDRYLVGRDHMGIIPLYWGRDESGCLYFSSEMKGLIDCCKTLEEFPPGHYWDSKDEGPTKYYQRDWFEYDAVKSNEADPVAIHDALEESVKSHLMSDVPFGVLLSGGLDSSVVSAVAQKYSKMRVEDNSKSEAWWPQIHSFAIGLEGSPDLAAAQEVADEIGTIHHSMHFTVQDGIDALRDVIYHIETYDVTTIRASTPMWLLARKIKAMGIKMVLSGEGADEIFGGYLYFHKAPNAQEFHEETVRKLASLHLYDCLRANKSMAAWGVEARVPFLDKQFMDVAMRLNPEAKMCTGDKIEKNILRTAFNESDVPQSVLWRQKEQFSDGVGYSWIDELKVRAEELISDSQMENAAFRFPHNPPATKEAYMYREIFESVFPHPDAVKCVPGGKSIACSTPTAIAWDEAFQNMADPSGRAVKSVHEQSY